MNVEMKDTLMKAAQYATEDKHMQMKKLTGYILSAFGCFLILSGFTVFPSESGWAAKFAILGAIIVTIGIFQLLKKCTIMVNKKSMYSSTEIRHKFHFWAKIFVT